jgi:methylated-DNA-[protein]-cysteine S-methyltransferase
MTTSITTSTSATTSTRATTSVTTGWRRIDSPVGPLLLTATASGDSGNAGAEGRSAALTGIFFVDHRGGADARLDAERLGPPGDDPGIAGLLDRAQAQLAEYFAGERREFDLPLAPAGTPFQHRVWAALRAIPYGQKASYGDIAGRLGLGPAAARAVGLATGSNPISIVVPCHRVIGADGTLTGYGGGLERKQFLLDLESDQLF